jgi:hypothetical protein
MRYDHIAGAANVMVDDAFCLWNLTNSQLLLLHFQQTYPHSQPWQLRMLQPPTHSALISSLQRTRVAPASVLNVPPHMITPGTSGSPTVLLTVSTPYWQLSQTQSLTYQSLHNASAMDALPKTVTPSKLAQWRTPFVPLARQWPAWEPLTNISLVHTSLIIT